VNERSLFIHEAAEKNCTKEGLRRNKYPGALRFPNGSQTAKKRSETFCRMMLRLFRAAWHAKKRGNSTRNSKETVEKQDGL